MTNLKQIENKVNELNNAADFLAYNFDKLQYVAETIMLNAMPARVTDELVDKSIKHCSEVLVNFKKLTDEEQRYYATVDILRYEAVMAA